MNVSVHNVDGKFYAETGSGKRFGPFDTWAAADAVRHKPQKRRKRAIYHMKPLGGYFCVFRKKELYSSHSTELEAQQRLAEFNGHDARIFQRAPHATLVHDGDYFYIYLRDEFASLHTTAHKARKHCDKINLNDSARLQLYSSLRACKVPSAVRKADAIAAQQAHRTAGKARTQLGRIEARVATRWSVHELVRRFAKAVVAQKLDKAAKMLEQLQARQAELTYDDAYRLECWTERYQQELSS